MLIVGDLYSVQLYCVRSMQKTAQFIVTVCNGDIMVRDTNIVGNKCNFSSL